MNELCNSAVSCRNAAVYRVTVGSLPPVYACTLHLDRATKMLLLDPKAGAVVKVTRVEPVPV